MRLKSVVLELDGDCRTYVSASSKHAIRHRPVDRLWSVTRKTGMNIQLIMDEDRSPTSYEIDTFVGGWPDSVTLIQSAPGCDRETFHLRMGRSLCDWAWCGWTIGCRHLLLKEWA